LTGENGSDLYDGALSIDRRSGGRVSKPVIFAISATWDDERRVSRT
jgi:hypothetical protein